MYFTKKAFTPYFSGVFGPLLVRPTTAELDNYRQNLPAAQGEVERFRINNHYFIATTPRHVGQVNEATFLKGSGDAVLINDGNELLENLVEKNAQSTHPAHLSARH